MHGKKVLTRFELCGNIFCNLLICPKMQIFKFVKINFKNGFVFNTK